ncbi:Protein SOK1 [Pleurostoma richardsiae]|uniref:Protein SOK1 n=1 Tax=Pleurostoma richardsiae TaxID=41990 RepID=A0AA38VFH1_9PEZI|nr:Protein SOK1 [Pleurostoma richardsiae]
MRTLAVLNKASIEYNPELRHDMNFDPKLHFRPNREGGKGRRKQEEANHFWSVLKDQLDQFVTDRETFNKVHPRGDDWCLPALLKEVKEIILTLASQQDHDLLEGGLNVKLLMSQFYNGVIDMEKQVAWLADVLKSYCAPMRDEWVDEMYQEVCNGNQNNDMGEVVKGLRNLLGILEAMKLDVANHHIRCLRPVLIEHTVDFEQQFFEMKIAAGKLDISAAKTWYDAAVRNYSGFAPYEENTVAAEMAAFFEGLCQLIMPSTDSGQVPETFLFDKERLAKLRSDMLDAINIEICMRYHEDLERASRIRTIASCFGVPAPVPPYVAEADREFKKQSGSDFNFDSPSSQPASNGSSLRNSEFLCPQPQATNLDDGSRTRSIYNCFLALLHTAPATSNPSQRWEALAKPSAIQISRYTNMPQDVLSLFEAKLTRSLCNPSDERHREVEGQFLTRLRTELAKRVREFKDLSGVDLFYAATGGRTPGPGRTWGGPPAEGPSERGVLQSTVREARVQGVLQDIATRLAHLGVLHWRVWAQLAYVDVDVDVDDLVGMGCQSPRTKDD